MSSFHNPIMQRTWDTNLRNKDVVKPNNLFPNLSFTIPLFVTVRHTMVEPPHQTTVSSQGGSGDLFESNTVITVVLAGTGGNQSPFSIAVFCFGSPLLVCLPCSITNGSLQCFIMVVGLNRFGWRHSHPEILSSILVRAKLLSLLHCVTVFL